jgi:predicted amidohydrolase
VNPFRVVLSFENEDFIPPLQPDQRVGVALPWTGKDAFKWDECGDPIGTRFFNVRPVDEDQRAVIRRVLDAAERARLAVAVLPELAVDDAGHDEVNAWWGAERRGLGLLVAGSRHLTTADGKRVNRATVLLRAGRSFSHDKFTPYEMRRDDGSTSREDIATSSMTVSVHYSEGWSVATLICKDLMDERVASLLAQLRVRLVLAPAFSERTAPFRARLEQLACDAQAIVVVANTPGNPESEGVLVALPVERSSVRSAPPRRGVGWVRVGTPPVQVTWEPDPFQEA